MDPRLMPNFFIDGDLRWLFWDMSKNVGNRSCGCGDVYNDKVCILDVLDIGGSYGVRLKAES